MAAEKQQVYKCRVCGIVAEILDGGAGEMSCCNEPMALLKANTVDAAKEKHVPVIEEVDGGVKVKVGSVAHPMEAKHFIQWIELISGGKSYRQFLEPGQEPEATFRVKFEDVDAAREICNLHGLWKS